MRSGHGRRFAPGVRLILALMALLPLVGLSWFSVRSLQLAAERAEAAATLERSAPELTALSLLDSQISTESYWGNAIVTATSLGVPADLMSAVLGFDMEKLYSEAQDLAEAGAIELGLDGIASGLAEARLVASKPETTLTQLDLVYVDVKQDLDAIIEHRVESLVALANQVPGSEATARSVEILDLAVQLRERASLVATSYFTARYASDELGEDPVGDFVGAVALYDDATTRLEDLLLPDTGTSSAWQQARTDPLVVELLDRASTTARGYTTGSIDPSQGLDFASIDIEAEAAAFLNSLDAVDRHVEFVDAAAAELTATASVLEAAQLRAQRNVFITTTVTSGLSLLAVLLASWWIIRPLRRVAEVVAAMRQGELGESVPLTGPREVRGAAQGINEAADHLKLAERQAAVLADEDLDNPILRTTAPGKLGESLQTAVRRLADTLGEREEFRRRLQHEATHDGLTGLANRSAAMESLAKSLARARRSAADVAVLFVDVDEFKQVNDVYGHEAGDHLLKTIAERIVATVREGDLVARLGGDEFLVVAEPIGDAEEAVWLGQRMLERISEPVTVGASEILPSVSIGVSTAGSTDLSPDEILRDADLAVYRAKELGRSRVEVCDLELRKEIARQIDIESSLRDAIEHNDLMVHYQPIVDAVTGVIVSLEALVRWDRPGYGIIGPHDFVPVAERSELVVALDRWVLGRVVRQLSSWTGHPTLGTLPIAVNLSPRHIASPWLTSEVLGSLEAAEVDPSRLVLEITESALLDDLDAAASQFNELRSRGVQVALDDFGTGYTSLALLRKLPVDLLKIDQSFTTNLDNEEDQSLVRLIVETGHLLGVLVVAEGVETADQARRLAEMGSDHLQGFGFCRPVDPHELERLVGYEPEPVFAVAASHS